MYNIKEYFFDEKEMIRRKLKQFTKETPELLIIKNYNEDKPADMYARAIMRDCSSVGIYPKFMNAEEFNTRKVRSFSKFLDEIKKKPIVVVQGENPIVESVNIPPICDVEGLKSKNYLPACGKGLIDYLRFNGEEIEGKKVLIIGRGPTMGEPLRRTFSELNATVTVAHSKTPESDIEIFANAVDIIITATNIPYQFNWPKFNSMHFNKDQILIDTATCFTGDGELVGNCTPSVYDAYDKCIKSPGGMGLLTRAGLLNNIYRFYWLKNSVR